MGRGGRHEDEWLQRQPALGHRLCCPGHRGDRGHRDGVLRVPGQGAQVHRRLPGDAATHQSICLMPLSFCLPNQQRNPSPCTPLFTCPCCHHHAGSETFAPVHPPGAGRLPGAAPEVVQAHQQGRVALLFPGSWLAHQRLQLRGPQGRPGALKAAGRQGRGRHPRPAALRCRQRHPVLPELGRRLGHLREHPVVPHAGACQPFRDIWRHRHRLLIC